MQSFNTKTMSDQLVIVPFKFIRGIYNDTGKRIYPFSRLKEMYNLPESDFFKYLSLVNSIPSIWKTRTRNENINIPETPNLFSQILNQKQINRYIYNYLKYKELERVRRSEMKWSQMLSDITLNWKSIYTNTLRATKDIKIQNFQYKYLMRIIPNNNFLLKFKLVNSALCDF